MMLWLTLVGCTPERWCQASGTDLHTSWNARWQSEDCSTGQTALTGLAAALDAELSVFDESSQLQRLNRAPGPMEVGEDLFVLVGQALDLAAASQGAFDPTLEPLMVAWGFHRDGDPTPPSPADLSQALERVGYEAVERTRVRGVATLDRHGRQLDVSGMLEGYAADRLSGELSSLGIAHSLIQVGDEVRVQGRGPHGLWRVGVPGTQTVLAITNRGVASAGHPDEPTSTLNPKTGQLAASDVRHVTVLAPTAAEADGLATAVRVAGSEAGLSLLSTRIDVSAWVVMDDGSVLTVGRMDPSQ